MRGQPYRELDRSSISVAPKCLKSKALMILLVLGYHLTITVPLDARLGLAVSLRRAWPGRSRGAARDHLLILGIRDSGLGIRDSGLGIRDSGFGIRESG